MDNTKFAMESYDSEGKRILFRACHNFGNNSYDPHRGLHRGQLSGKKIFATVVADKETGQETIFNQFPIIIFEN
jgi:hypothetical protein